MSVGQFLAGTPGASGGAAVETSNFLPGWYEDYLQRVNAGALAEASQQYTPYSGPRLAQTSNPTQQVRDRIQQNFTNPVYGGALDAAKNSLMGAQAPWSSATANQYMNPYTSGVADEVTRRATRNFQESVLPSISMDFTGGGQTGSAREMEMRARAARDFSEGLTGSLAGIMNTGYTGAQQQFNADRSAMLGAGGALTGLAGQQAGLEAGALGQMSAVGSDIESREQQSLDLGYGDFQRQLGHNWNQLNNLSSILRGQQMPTSGTTNQTSTQLPSGTLQLLSGAGALSREFGQMRRGGPVRARGYRHGGLVRPNMVPALRRMMVYGR